MPETLAILLIFVSYLLGSIPTAVWVSKAWFKDDVRRHGSGNAGSTNMFRVYGFKAGITTQLADIAKGAAAALLPVLFYDPEVGVFGHDLSLLSASLICGFVAALGHIWPVLAGFRGGKAINTLLGAMLVSMPLGALAALGIFILIVLGTRYVSLGSMLGGLTFAVFIALSPYYRRIDGGVALIIASVMALLVIYTHRTNISRLVKGTENQANIFRKKG